VPAKRAVIVGTLVALASLLLVLSPLVLGKRGPTKYIVAFALVGLCLGASILLHATFDLVRRR
jgi:hypothetical protein